MSHSQPCSSVDKYSPSPHVTDAHVEQSPKRKKKHPSITTSTHHAPTSSTHHQHIINTSSTHDQLMINSWTTRTSSTHHQLMSNTSSTPTDHQLMSNTSSTHHITTHHQHMKCGRKKMPFELWKKKCLYTRTFAWAIFDKKFLGRPNSISAFEWWKISAWECLLTCTIRIQVKCAGVREKKFGRFREDWRRVSPKTTPNKLKTKNFSLGTFAQFWQRQCQAQGL